jgi:hypothetical protein
MMSKGTRHKRPAKASAAPVRIKKKGKGENDES